MGVLLALMLTGCESYALRGTIVAGTASRIEVVSEDDPRLDASPIGEASLVVVLEPDTLERRRLPEVRSDQRGRFAVAVDEVGAGWLDYRARVVSWHKDHARADATFNLPRSGKRLLVVLGPGSTLGPGLEADMIQDTMRFREVFER